MSDIELGTLYDMNKVAVAAETPLKKHEIKDKMRDIKTYFKEGNKYFMLLCRERSDYSIFNFTKKTDVSLQHAINDLQECLENRGKIMAINFERELIYEIWLMIKDQAYAYYLFPYDIGVLEE